MRGLSGPCSGIDEGDGFDCYGVPVDPGDTRTRRLTGVEQADVWRRLQLGTPQWYSFEERAHLQEGTFGVDGLTRYRVQYPSGAQSLPPVHVTAAPVWGWLALGVLAVLSSRKV